MADTASESSDEARIPLRAEVLRRSIREQDNGTEFSDEAMACYNRKRQLTSERSRSGSRAQSTAQYKEAATLCHGLCAKWGFKVNIFTKNFHHLNNSTHSQQQNERRRDQPSCQRTGWGSNNPHTSKKCTRYNSPSFSIRHVPARFQCAST
ncbi:hypothetical protein FHG87_025202 [Trinorchestia longiramus]|nr:hypothetical protein FHG87_025202 [Trinorchestia longiramus]